LFIIQDWQVRNNDDVISSDVTTDEQCMMNTAPAYDGTDTHQWNCSPFGQRPAQEIALSTADIDREHHQLVSPAISPVSQCVL